MCAAKRSDSGKGVKGRGSDDRAGSPEDAGPAEIVELDEAIRMMRTSRTTLYRWIREGKIKAMKAGRQWRFRREDIDAFLEGEQPRPGLAVSPAPLIEKLLTELEGAGAAKDVPDADGAPIGIIVPLIFRLALARRASDIHLAPYRNGEVTEAVLRFRVDGLLQVIATVDMRLLPHLIERIKALAGCDVTETARPQDGRIEITDNGKAFDLRVAFLPLGLGPSVIIRILSTADLSIRLEDIGYSPHDLGRIQDGLRHPNGFILFTGPTGSGKSTTLYAGLRTLSNSENKVLSVEDPIEYQMPWMDQVAVNAAEGLTFPRALRAILRADPDVVFCGEIRDRETLEICIQTALTGHLVLTTLHTQDAASVLPRLIDIGAAPFLVGETVILIISQRLVRRLCVNCKRPGKPGEKELRWARRMLMDAGIDEDSLEANFHEPVGCPQCANSGFRGRRLIAETLVMTPAIARALKERASHEEIRRLAIAGGMIPIGADAVIKAYQEGVTSLAEAYRATAYDLP